VFQGQAVIVAERPEDEQKRHDRGNDGCFQGEGARVSNVIGKIYRSSSNTRGEPYWSACSR
jgi:hypothetical protein